MLFTILTYYKRKLSNRKHRSELNKAIKHTLNLQQACCSHKYVTLNERINLIAGAIALTRLPTNRSDDTQNRHRRVLVGHDRDAAAPPCPGPRPGHWAGATRPTDERYVARRPVPLGRAERGARVAATRRFRRPSTRGHDVRTTRAVKHRGMKLSLARGEESLCATRTVSHGWVSRRRYRTIPTTKATPRG